MNIMKKTMLLVGLVMPSIGFAQNYSVDWHKIAGGGGTSSGGLYSVNGTIGQPDAGGAMVGGNYSLTGGFWSLISGSQTPGAPASGGQLLTFDDLHTSCYDPITNGYAGFNWTNVWVANSVCLGNGYVNGTISSPNVAFNGYGLDASFNVVSGTFSLTSAYVTSVNGSSITVEGYNGSTLVYNKAYPLNGAAPTFITFDYEDITEVYITGGKFALDNITINGTVAGKALTIVSFGQNFVLTWPTNFAGLT